MKRSIVFFLLIAMFISSFAFSVSAEELTGIVSDEGRFCFTDVRKDAWYADEVEFCYVNKIINGMSETKFSPNGKLTRAQFVTMLANLEGVGLEEYKVDKFKDVKPSHWYYGAVAWAYENEIVSGTSETAFSPNLEINRETLSRMLCLYMQKKGCEVSISDNVLDSFSDKGAVSYWALEGVEYLIGAGLMTGMTETTIAPRATVTRAQAARFLMVFVLEYKNGGHEHTFAYPDCVSNKVCTICGLLGGIPSGHILDRYDCITGGFCKRCSQKIDPSKTVHDFTVAGCTTPKICKNCGLVDGAALGHTTKFGICTRCNSEVFATSFDRISYYMVEEGIGNGNGVYNYSYLLQYNEKELCYVQVIYNAVNRDFDFKITYIWQDIASYLDFGIHIPMEASKYEYNTAFYADEKQVCSGSGTLDPKTVKSDMKFTLESFKGNDAEKADFEVLAKQALLTCVENADFLIYSLCGEGVDDFGFVNISHK